MRITLKRNEMDELMIEAWENFGSGDPFLLWVVNEDAYINLVDTSIDEITKEGITVELKIVED